MNLAELHRRQQVSVSKAAAAASSEAQSPHRRLANSYADRIKNFDEQLEERSTLRHPSVMSAFANVNALLANTVLEQEI